MDTDETSLNYGARPSKLNGRRRKGASDYAAENQDDFTFKAILQGGRYVNVLVCKFCAVVIGARSDRIKEHLSSKRHLRLKTEAMERGLGSYNDISSSSRACNGTSTFVPAPSSQNLSGDVDTEGGEGSSAASSPSTAAVSPTALLVDRDAGSYAEAVKTSKSLVLGDVSIMKFTATNMLKQPGLAYSFDSTLLHKNPLFAKESKYCVKWEKYPMVMKACLGSYQIEGYFTDVTLASDGKSIKCHKVVLSACSDYFFQLLKDNPCQHPIIIMKDTPFWELEALVKFFYEGEVFVKKDQVKPLIRTAGQLGVRGLTSSTNPNGRRNVVMNVPNHTAIGSNDANFPQMQNIPTNTGGASIELEPGSSYLQNNSTAVTNGTNLDFIGKSSKYFPRFGATSGGVCHEASPNSGAAEKKSVIAHNSLPGVNQVGNQALSSVLLPKISLFQPLLINSTQKEYLKKRKSRKRAMEIPTEPQITIRKVPVRSLTTAESDSGNIKQISSTENSDGDEAVMDWKNFIPKVEINDSEEQDGLSEDDYQLRIDDIGDKASGAEESDSYDAKKRKSTDSGN